MPMHTRAKFYLSGLTLLPGNTGVRADLSAVSRGDRNAQWASATPIGNLSMTINNPAAAAQWESFMQSSRATGKQPEVFLDISPATDGWPGDGHKFRLADIPEGVYGHGNCGECGMPKDADTTVWDAVKGMTPTGKAHPAG